MASTSVCGYCHRRFPTQLVDLAPRGERCANCKAAHDVAVLRGGDEQADELNAADMRAKASTRRTQFLTLIGVAIGMTVVGLFVSSGTLSARLLVFGVPSVGVLAAWAVIEWRRAHRSACSKELEELRSPGSTGEASPPVERLSPEEAGGVALAAVMLETALTDVDD